jgi:hypothetical protein
VGEEGGDRRAEELLAVAAPDHERALLAGGDDEARLVGGHGHERVVAAQARVGAAHGLLEAVAVEVRGDEVGDDLGVRLRREHRVRVHELLLERHVVLDDAVDHDVDAVRGVEVRVGVLLGDAAVGGPARVADPGRRGGREHGDAAVALELLHRVAQVGEVAHRTYRFEPALGLDRDPRRVVAAVLELAQPVEEDLLDRARAYVADYSAHEVPILAPVGGSSRPEVQCWTHGRGVSVRRSRRRPRAARRRRRPRRPSAPRP